MFEGYDFIFDGKSSIGENVKILYTERNAFGTTKGVPDKKHELFKGSRASRWRTTGISYEEPHQFDFQIMLHNDEALKYDEKNYYVKRNQISRFRHWLFDTTSFKKLQILNEDMRDLYFMCMFIDVEDLQDGGHIIGFRGTMLCDSVGAYEDKTIKKTCTGTTTFNIQCLQDSTMDITPIYKVKVQSTPLEIDVNGEKIVLDFIAPGSTITIDTDKMMMTHSETKNLYISDNKAFPVFQYGKNVITVTGNCELEIKYSLIREVGG